MDRDSRRMVVVGVVMALLFMSLFLLFTALLWLLGWLASESLSW